MGYLAHVSRETKREQKGFVTQDELSEFYDAHDVRLIEMVAAVNGKATALHH